MILRVEKGKGVVDEIRVDVLVIYNFKKFMVFFLLNDVVDEVWLNVVLCCIIVEG